MWQAAAEMQTAADPAAIWALWERAERWRDWNEQIAHAELLEPLALGSKARIRFKRQPRVLTFTIVALRPGELLTDEVKLPGVRLGHEHILRQAGATTTVRHRLYLDGPAAAFYSVLMGRRMRTALAQFLEREKALVEGG